MFKTKYKVILDLIVLSSILTLLPYKKSFAEEYPKTYQTNTMNKINDLLKESGNSRQIKYDAKICEAAEKYTNEMENIT